MEDKRVLLSGLVVVCAVFGVLSKFAAAQTVHVVGNDMGWDIPDDPSSSYDNWVAGRIFRVGDTLEFDFDTNEHDVVQVPQASYTACTGNNAIGSPIMIGPANVTLDSAGDRYYICTFGTHCRLGQRLAITVFSSSANPPATPPPATRPTSPPPRSNQPNAGGPVAGLSPRPANSGSVPLATGFSLSLLTAAGLAFVL